MDCIYIGEIYNNYCSGKGKICCGDFYYEGNFVKNKMCGYGKFESAECSKFEGVMSNDMFLKGKYISSDKKINYEGDFLNGNFNKGIMKIQFNSNYCIYEGTFMDGLFNGNGILKLYNSETSKIVFVIEGNFKKGKEIGEIKISFSDSAILIKNDGEISFCDFVVNDTISEKRKNKIIEDINKENLNFIECKNDSNFELKKNGNFCNYNNDKIFEQMSVRYLNYSMILKLVKKYHLISDPKEKKKYEYLMNCVNKLK
jgi:hypothetical protein